MSKSIVYVTGNAEKMRDAHHVCVEYNVSVEQAIVEIDEIQHHDPLKIAEHKAKKAYEVVGRPVVINDSSWSIPALGGFPGGYMKDVTQWLSTEDFMHLMKRKQDKSIILTDTNGYYDGNSYKSFTATRYGMFIEEPRGSSEPTFARLVVLDADTKTISEIFDEPTRTVSSTRYVHWHAFLKWYTSQ